MEVFKSCKPLFCQLYKWVVVRSNYRTINCSSHQQGPVFSLRIRGYGKTSSPFSQLHLCFPFCALALCRILLQMSCSLSCRHTAPCKRSWCHLDGGFCATRSTDTFRWSLLRFMTRLKFCIQVRHAYQTYTGNTHTYAQKLIKTIITSADW